MEIKFKATKRKHSSGWADIEKHGDLEFDHDKFSRDGIWLYLKSGNRIFIDCDYKTKEFRIVFQEEDFEKSKY